MPSQIKENNLSVKSRYRREIDGLRAFAVVAVIINHFNKEILPNGYLGVDIFFVISGFVITSSLYQRPSKNFKDFISGFYERRIKRLVPALSIFVLITSIAICLFNPNPSFSLKTGLTSLFGLSNIFLFQKSTDYFAQSTELNVFTHTWSLGVEEQYYILFPFLIWFSGFGRQTKNGARNLFLTVGVLTIASLIGFLYLYQTNQPSAYFLMPTRFWEMSAGCLLFIGLEKRKSIEQFLEKVPPILVLALIIGVMYLPMSLATFSTVLVVFLSLVLIASLKKGTTEFTFFTNSKVVYVGLISYSLYLWHWGVLSISRWSIGIHWWSFPFQLAIIFALAVASYQWIETPLRKGNWFGNRWKTLVVSGGVLILLSSTILGSVKTRRYELLFLGEKPFDLIDLFNKEIFNSQISINTCKLLSNNSIENCIAKPLRKGAPNVLLIGDSHSSQWYQVLSQIRESDGIGIYTHIAGWNPPAQIYPPIRYISGTFGKKQWQVINYYQERMVRRFFDDSKPGDIAILGSRIGGHFKDYKVRQYFLDDWSTKIDHADALDIYLEYVSEFVRVASQYNVTTFLIPPIPKINVVNLELCNATWFRPPKIARKKCMNKNYYSEINEKLKEFTTQNPNINLIDLDFSMLDDFRENYLDNNHLSPKGSLLFKNEFKNIIFHIDREKIQ